MIGQLAYRPMGTIVPITTCPHCSKLVNGSCEMCTDGDPHPSCEQCVGGRIVTPWYMNELLLTIGTSVVVAVASAIILAKIQKGARLGD